MANLPSCSRNFRAYSYISLGRRILRVLLLTARAAMLLMSCLLSHSITFPGKALDVSPWSGFELALSQVTSLSPLTYQFYLLVQVQTMRRTINLIVRFANIPDEQTKTYTHLSIHTTLTKPSKRG
ncbi:hypothetical protein CPAR01_05749 [Colletotrichum paranaense]|uniref:Uncharacterized protein n=1 Tax=Colletotrichum paranaense TaxID=1914294 RepID=A0ABQ9STF3_9PEZI|nr:uncharacterized protein CPAR01_05749 [Colletotrichum paranaense]KAK1542362.1 hypothetical protein CPAR01_05749 [Colletotrichum paranaense]